MDPQIKTQVVERVRQANNILVTVSTNPSVDQLASCIGLTLLLNKMEKHATAVFSGKVPPMLEFLEPGKTIETNTDSLRDFIISLDKNKADKLRYKVEDQVVRIFITPYKTSLGEADLEFSQGDFNVELVIALGVKDKAHIDAAITAHGRILHDATVITVNATAEKNPDIGQMNWVDTGASSLSEMIVSISEAFGSGLIDTQMANAFLTGIVAETERFKNTKTNPKVMTIAAQLMAAGANQQLIVSKLEPPAPPPLVPAIPAAMPSAPAPGPKVEAKPAEAGTLSVSHKPNIPDSGEVHVNGKEIRIDDQGNLKSAAEAAKAASLPKPTEEPKPLPLPAAEAEKPAQPVEDKKPDKTPPGPHSFLDSKGGAPNMSAASGPDKDDYQTPIDPLAEPKDKSDGFLGHARQVAPPNPTLEFKPPSEENTPAPQPVSVDKARNAVETAFAAGPAPTNPLAELAAQEPPSPPPAEPQKTPEAQPPKHDDLQLPQPDEKKDQNQPAPPPGPPPITFDPSLLGKDDKK